MSNDKKHAVFLGLYNKGYPLYENYPNTPKIEDRHQPIPSILMLNRWDGKIGFPGGKVDPGETQLEALARELKEEINYDLKDRPLFVCTVETSSTFLHFYRLEVSFAEIKRAMLGALEASHFYSEITGVFIQHMRDYEGGKGLKAFLEGNNLCPGVKIEIETLLRECF